MTETPFPDDMPPRSHPFYDSLRWSFYVVPPTPEELARLEELARQADYAEDESSED